jgi:hypothetical protein
MISKYVMICEAVHYGNIIESSLPIITDAVAVYEPLEADLEKAANLFNDRMGRCMQRKSVIKNITKFVKI